MYDVWYEKKTERQWVEEEAHSSEKRKGGGEREFMRIRKEEN